MTQTIEVLGRSPAKISLDRVSVNRIFLDFENPRITGKRFESEVDLMAYMYAHYALEELALSMSQFGYFDAEPIVVIPKSLPPQFEHLSQEELAESEDYRRYIKDTQTEFIVVEGNRRLSTIKLLLDIDGYRDLLSVRKDIFKSELSSPIKVDLEAIPVIVYPERKDITPYLGVKHIGGSKPWETYAQALYIASLIDDQGYNLSDVKDLMSDTSGKVVKNYLSLRLFELAENNGIDTNSVKSLFSLMVLSIGQKSIKDYLGLPKNLAEIDLSKGSDIISEEKIENFLRFFKWIFGDSKSGTLRIITESRDITGKITKILANEKATTYLEKSRDIEGAFERSDGEKDMVLSGLALSHRRLLNLKDTLDYLLTEGKILISDVKEDVFYLQKDIESINAILAKHSS